MFRSHPEVNTSIKCNLICWLLAVIAPLCFFYCTNPDDGSATVIFSKIKVYDIDVDMVWRAKFMKHAQTFYDLYLKWLYCNPIDRTRGIAVASSLLA